MVDFNWSNVTSWQDFLTAANTNTGNWFWAVMGVFLPFIIATIVLLPTGWEAALMGGAFVGFILSILLAYAGLVAWWVVGTFVGIIIFMILYIYWSSRYNY